MVWILCRMHEKHQLNYISMLLSAIFVIPNSHFGAYFVKLGHFYEEMGKITFILQRDVPVFIPSWTNISFRVTKFGTKLSYNMLLQKYISLLDNHFIVFRILNVREGYPHPQIPNFDDWTKDGIWWPISPLQLLHHSNWTQIEYKA